MDNVDNGIQLAFQEGSDGIEIVDSIVDDTKTFKLYHEDISLGEGNQIELPFVAPYRSKEPIREYKYEYTVWENGIKVKRGCEVFGHQKYGVPTTEEYEVLMAMVRIFVRNKKIPNEDGVYRFKKENLLIEDLCIYFTFKELALEMGYTEGSANSTKTKNRLKKSLEILTASTVKNFFNGCLFDKEHNEYLDCDTMYHFLENLETYEYKKVRKGEKRISATDIKGKTKVYFNSFFFKSLLNYYFIYNSNIMRNQKLSSASKKIGMLFYKWRGKRNKLLLNYETICERLPMVNDSVKKRNAYIKNIFTELSESEYFYNIQCDTKKTKVEIIYELGEDLPEVK